TTSSSVRWRRAEAGAGRALATAPRRAGAAPKPRAIIVGNQGEAARSQRLKNFLTTLDKSLFLDSNESDSGRCGTSFRSRADLDLSNGGQRWRAPRLRARQYVPIPSKGWHNRLPSRRIGVC